MTVLSKFAEGSSSPSSTNRHKHDVFLSFRGVDTRNNFTDHLHKALLDANISTFLDDDEIEAGGDLKPELECAIKESRASVIILSKNYANSSWCLDELVLILEQRMTSNQIVIPIFFHVEPSDIRKQESNFALSIAEHKEKMEAEKNASKKRQLAQKIDRWIKALTEVANLKGMHAKGRRETKFIAEIVEDIYRKLHVPARSAQPLIGMEESIDFVTSWLRDGSSNTGDILTILGMGGIGKTSLAKYVYGLHFREFDTRSYIEDIGRRCAGKYNGLLDLTKQLCDDISKRSLIQVYDVSVYTSKIENVLANKKVFLVLDDINSLDQLDALLGNKGFHPQSKIIITSRNAWLTKSCALFKKEVVPRHEEHWLQGLDKAHSLQLLCFHALKSKDPKPGYEIVSEKFMKYCSGHPLTLEVLGKSLHKRDAAYWEECIEGLGKENDSRIMDVLKMSYDSLPSRNDKELFKHIACFFVGMDRDFCDTILKACDIKTSSGITNLIDRCLLSIGWNNKLVMHQLLQEMGRFIVREESLDKPSEQSRLWCHEDSSRVLKQKKGTENTRGLTLDTRMLKNKRLRKTFELELDALSTMDSLMLLQLNYVKFNGSYENFPEELRWLCMHGFPLKSIPSDLPMQNLVALDMSDSKIKSFGMCYKERPLKRQKLNGSCSKDKILLGSLKILNLSFCKELHSICGFDGLPALERLIATNCSGLLEVCESIEQCDELVFVDLSYCNKLDKLPQTIGMLKKVEELFLDGCNLGQSRLEIRDTDYPEKLKANHTGITVMKPIPTDLKLFTISLPGSLVRLSLKNNNLSTESIPMDLSCLSMLEELYLDGNPIVFLPDCVRNLPRLEILRSDIAGGTTYKRASVL
ncbi:disease resistance protein RUN1 isoform X3 [Lactuca sativa]|uniref:disease resistance protein RUN1 isoform X3 n=1 Tax=Lactuca sativa TaxID=4236 RepID=UPI000CD889CE|nr:disease resistance protein RUN1 isoform X3 [Lactuca sativa]